jgi:hypothetical protein
MNEAQFNDLLEAAWRRELAASEREALLAYTEAHPEARTRLDEELAIGGLLSRLPEAHVPSNFTWQVMREIEREESGRSNSSLLSGRVDWQGTRWFKPAAIGLTALCVAVFSLHGFRVHSRKEIARSLATISEAAPFGLLLTHPQTPAPKTAPSPVLTSTPSLQVFQDFEAIRHLSYLPDPGDAQLLAYLQD